MPNFCTNCGSKLDPATGLCPLCNKQSEAEKVENNVSATSENAAATEEIGATTVLNNYPGQTPGVATDTTVTGDIGATTVLSNYPGQTPEAATDTTVTEDIGATTVLSNYPGQTPGAVTDTTVTEDIGATTVLSNYPGQTPEAVTDTTVTEDIGATTVLSNYPGQTPGAATCASVPETPAASMVFCPKCGTKMNADAGACPNCGAPNYLYKPASAPSPAFAPTQAHATAPKPAPVKKAKVRKKRSPIFTVLVVILSLILTLTTISAVALFGASKAISANTIESIMDEVNFKEILDNAVDYSDEDVDKFLITLKDNYEIEATLEDLDDFLSKTSVKSFASEKLSSFATAFINGDTSLEISKKEIVDLIMENQKYIEDKFDKKLTKEDAQEIADKFFKGSSMEIISRDNINKFVDSSVISAVKLVMSPALSIAFMVICLIIIALMIICHPSRAACCIGGIYITLGVIFSAAALLAGSIVSSVINIPVISVIINNTMMPFLICGAVLFAIGVVSLIIRGIVKAILRKKLSAE